MNVEPSPELHYRTRFASSSLRPGAHRSRVAGPGLDVAASVPLARARDPRRLDLRAALRDPFGGWWAHEYRQRASVSVLLLIDTSASMQPRQAAALSFARALRHAAQRRGDAFGVIAFADTLRDEHIAAPSLSRAPADALLDRLSSVGAFDGRNADSLLRAAECAPRAASLVFLLSDFLFDPALLDCALALLARHDVIPVWLQHAPPAADGVGLLELRDAESGAWRSLWMRPSLARRWAAARAAHEDAVRAALARHQRAPLVVAAQGDQGERFDADAANAYFAARV
jgi:VWA domain containing CoxE-like protein